MHCVCSTYSYLCTCAENGSCKACSASGGLSPAEAAGSCVMPVAATSTELKPTRLYKAQSIRAVVATDLCSPAGRYGCGEAPLLLREAVHGWCCACVAAARRMRWSPHM